jgi:hypothetical protein
VKRHYLLGIALVAAVSAATLVPAGWGGPTAAPRVRTLLSTQRQIFAFAQGKGQVTWINRAGPGQKAGCAMDVRKLGGHRTGMFPLPSCAVLLRSVPLALANGEAAWSKDFDYCGLEECHWKVVGISANPKHRRFRFSVSVPCANYPDECSSIVGEAAPMISAYDGLLVYNANGIGGAQGAPGQERVDELVGGRSRQGFAVTGLIEGLAVGGNVIYTLNLVCSASCGTQSEGYQFHTTSGKKLAQLPGLPVLAGGIAAVPTVLTGGVDQITLYQAFTGTQLATIPVGHATNGFSLVGADAHWVVFRIARTISALNVNSHQVDRLTTTAPNPLDISVSGRRVAWAENIHGRGRIRALELPS